MKYVACQVSNYKSFNRSPEIPFHPSFNVVIGANNTGKTALLEALSLRFTHAPHRSLATARIPSAPALGTSDVDFTYSVSGQEISEVLDEIPTGHPLRVPYSVSSPTSGREEGERLLTQLKEASGIKLRVRVSGGQLTTVEPLTEPYTAGTVQDGRCAIFQRSSSGQAFTFLGPGPSDGARLEFQLARAFQARVYHFRAERLNIGVFAFGNKSELSPDANNLPQVLHVLQSNNWTRFRRYNELVSRVFPGIRRVAVRPVENQNVEIAVWEHAPETERQDLAVPLSQSGTGISQVLAMLYVVVTAETARVITIDEPNSFLHPGAVRALLEIFREHPRHQYIFTTHAPQTVASVGPSALIHWLRKDAEQATTLQQVDPDNTAHVRELLSDVGARLSDVFGSDSVLWVEGATEEDCFRLVIERGLRIPLRGVSVVGVLHTADFEPRDARWALEVYRRLSTAGGVMPPAIGFIFDRELRTTQEMEDLERESRGSVSFLPSRMYENYLLVPGAISYALGLRGVSVAAEIVEQALTAHRADPKFFPKGDTADPSSIDGAAVLGDMFWALSGGKTEYRKVIDGVALTTWLLDHDSGALSAVAQLLREKLGRAVGLPASRRP